ncbi:hypothetical protein DICSQDRAFT_171859 [Dichomitus squalens LYAD-421 SS1]|uniref:3'-5' exonuclease domain-containing protein n=1 Tax=Dichomitus squalens (strain LYAD-421) TaxID=732165 RepID=R7SU13_DICSQ|nr:uncharacterized protein DICSQDRAFT_171859 [Dichomitus squalens LYAD-421 SS1]EJF59684.1 hypothetical protein DICSQDRAFT_171859 [Dichomitus squalens LYAD-421 SS1]
MSQTTGSMRYTLCDTYEAAAEASDALSRHETLILDCEGRDIGMPDGELGIIAIGDSTASHVYLFDTLALSNKQHPLLSRLFTLLRRPDIMKLVWDGRSDFFEIADTYGVLMQGVVDLQLAEAAQRARLNPRKRKGFRAGHTLKYFKKMQDELLAEPAALEGIHRLFGLEHCAGIFQALDESGGKDPAVVAMHYERGGDMWMLRPLPAPLLRYSCHDIEMIAAMYARFSKFGYLKPLDELKATTERYLHSYPTRELRALHASLDLCKFVPMDVLTPPIPNTMRRAG